MTQEHKNKIGAALKGRVYSPETLLKMRSAKLGKVLTQEHKEKIRLGRIGKKHSEETKNKMHLAHLGEKSHCWRGGITPINQRIRGSAQYKNWKKMVLDRDKNACIECGSTEKLEIDHIKPFAKFPKLRLEISNGRTLCKTCHKKTPTYCKH